MHIRSVHEQKKYETDILEGVPQCLKVKEEYEIKSETKKMNIVESMTKMEHIAENYDIKLENDNI